MNGCQNQPFHLGDEDEQNRDRSQDSQGSG